VPETRDPGHSNLDPLGSVLSCLAAGALVLAVTEGPVRGWTDGITVGAVVVGLMASAEFFYWESFNPRPILNLRLFRNRSFSTGAGVIVIVMFAGFGWFFLTFQYEAYVLGYGPLKSALGLMAGAVTVVPAAAVGPALAARIGRQGAMTTALCIMTLGAVVMAAVGHLAMYWPIGIGFAIFGVGCGLGTGPPTEAVIESLPPGDQGVASAVNDTAREFGAAIGIAVLGSAFNAGYRSRVDHLLASTPSSIGSTIRSSPAAALDLASRSSSSAGHELAIVHAGVISGWETALATMAAISILGVVLVLARFPKKQEGVGDGGQPTVKTY
jgi:predicted MFS family arabinose efflux permease